jgi:hypothetical protein
MAPKLRKYRSIESYKKNGPVLYVRNIPLGVKNGFKAACALRNIDMGDKLISLIMDWLRKPEGKETTIQPRRKKGGKVIYIRHVPAQTKDAFKAQCILRNTQMENQVIALILEWLKKIGTTMEDA